MTGKFFIGLGTLGCNIIGSLKQKVTTDQLGLTRFIGIDTHEDALGLQNLNPEERIWIGEVPIAEIFQHPAEYGKRVDGIFLDQLANHPSDLRQGGCLSPTVTHLAVRYFYNPIETLFSCGAHLNTQVIEPFCID